MNASGMRPHALRRNETFRDPGRLGFSLKNNVEGVLDV